MKNEVEKHYSVQEIAELLGVTVRTVWNYIDVGTRSGGKDGIHPVIKLSHKATRIPARAVNRFLESRTLSPEPALQEAQG